MPSGNQNYQAFHTWKEILSQGEIWRATLDELQQCETVAEIVRASAETRQWIFVGCGTSYYLAEAAGSTWTALTGQPAHAVPASEVLLFPALLRTEGTGLCAIAISRSGQTSETVRAASILQQELRVPTIGITCVPDSGLQRACEKTIALKACDEKSMVMTRSFTSMLLGLQFLAGRVGGKAQFTADLRAMAAQFATQIAVLGQTLDSFIAKHDFDDFVFLGQGAFYGIAREASLKMMEMSCSYSQFFHTLEFRHGPKAIVSPRTCLTFFVSETGQSAESEVLAEMKELGATTIAICNRASQTVRESSDLVIELKLDAPELALLAPYTVPGQFCGFFNAMRKGLNPDEPKNLARVVILD